MGRQDSLAVVSAGRSLESASLRGESLAERAGLYLAVGYLPFEREDIDRILEGSVEDGAFSPRRFSEEGLFTVHPNLTFRCLSNMPAYHISMNFDIQGPYFVTYPGLGQWYTALSEAVDAITTGEVEFALLAAVAYQRNFLVEHLMGRVEPPVPPDDLRDGGACLVLERKSHAVERGAIVRGELRDHALEYVPYHPFEEAPQTLDRVDGPDGRVVPPAQLGPARLATALCHEGPGVFRHEFQSRDGLRGRSEWEMA